MQELPRDLISSMMVYLDLPSLNRLSQTSKLINAAANSDLLWKQKCELIENEPKLYGQVTNWKQLFRELSIFYKNEFNFDKIIGNGGRAQPIFQRTSR